VFQAGENPVRALVATGCGTEYLSELWRRSPLSVEQGNAGRNASEPIEPRKFAREADTILRVEGHSETGVRLQMPCEPVKSRRGRRGWHVFKRKHGATWEVSPSPSGIVARW